MTRTLFTERGEPYALDEQRALIALTLISGVGPGRIRALLAQFGSAADVMAAPAIALAEAPGIGYHTARAIATFDDEEGVEEQLRRAEQAGAEMVTSWAPHFPALLREIYDPPVFFWKRGSLTPADERAIAIVGTRKCTDYGRRLAFKFAAELAQRGITVVSGLAYGIDGAAHRGALEAGGRTIAVLGSGVDNIYPGRHNEMARKIIRHGAIISEYPMGAKPDAPNFPRRNRIISGLSLGVLVVEAHETGGALITARLANEQNREVFAIPSSVHSSAGVGTNRLIQRGHARLVLSVEDILEDVGLQAEDQVASTDEVPDDLNDVERRLYEALSKEPVHIDDLCTEVDLDPSSALVYLLNLEFRGLVRQMAGKQFFRA